MSFHFKPFKDDWLTHSDLFDKYSPSLKYTTTLDAAFFDELSFSADSLLQYRIDAAISASQQLGSNPVLCFSGGIDSQAMIQAWIEAGLKFDVAIGVFENNLNAQDTDHAILFCDKVGITPVLVNIDIISFLTRENLEFGEKYKCTSPHFNAHYKMFDLLRSMGYTGICCGGTAFAPGKEGWGPVPTPAQMNYVEYVRLNEFPIIGNFLGYDPKLCWTIALLTPAHETTWFNNTSTSKEQLIDDNDKRYKCKVLGYNNHGFDILPQLQKYTGFELVKDYFEDKYNDGWAFEKKFRHPLEKKFGNARGELVLTKEQLEKINDLYVKNGFSSIFAATGITV